jgi:large subunit ribosomal protein L9
MATKLLLLDDVEDLGRSGDVVSVKPGYARNFLLPLSLAVIADKQALRKQKKLQEERQLRAAEDKKEAEALTAKLTEMAATLTVTVKVDHEGHMYGSVTANEIVHLANEQLNLHLEKRFVQLKHPIKETGVHIIPLRLKEGIESSLTLKVEPEQQPN